MRRILLLIVCGVALASASPALASGGSSNPSSSTYGGQANSQLSQVQGQNTNTTPGGPTGPTALSSGSAASLPFTGLNVGLVAAIAIALVGGGFVLRTRSRPRAD